jgi:hypothetical protein
MGLNYEGWVKGTHASYGDDPAEFNGNNTPCKLCEKDAENMDEYCEDHQRCIMCGDNNDCTCKEEWNSKSDCCEAKMDTNQKMCYKCKDHCKSVWEATVKMCNKIKTSCKS